MLLYICSKAIKNPCKWLEIILTHQGQLPGHPERKHEFNCHLDLINGANAGDHNLHSYVGLSLVLEHWWRFLVIDILVDDNHLTETFIRLVKAVWRSITPVLQQDAATAEATKLKLVALETSLNVRLNYLEKVLLSLAGKFISTLMS